MSYKNTIMENFQGLSSRLARVIALAGVVWIASSVNPVSAQQFKDYTLTIPETSVEMDFVAVPGGTFLMGSDANEAGRNDNEGPQRAVQVDPFWMGKYEISWEQYNLFVEEEIPALTQKIEKKAGDLEIGRCGFSAYASLCGYEFRHGQGGISCDQHDQLCSDDVCKM